MIGKKISHYQIVEKLGEGGMASVYRAEDTRLHRQVALKFLPSDALAREEDRSRFLAEARAAATLDHPNICTVHEINEADDYLFISMAYVEGRDLKKRIDQDGPMSVLEATKVGVQIAEGLTAAHEKGIIHRDIKSANIMITPRGQAKIMDFGLADRLVGEHSELSSSTLGTVAYGSPEQVNGDIVDQRGDIWSFGVTLYELLTGELPFKGDYESAVVYSVLNENPASPKTIRDEIPEELDRIVLKALAKNPDDRYQSAESMLEDLTKVRNELDPTISRVGHAGDRAGETSGSWLYRAAIAVVAYLGVTWLLVRLVGLLVGRMQLSPEVVSLASAALLSLLPAVILISVASAKHGEERWKKSGWIGVATNVVISAVVLTLVFSGRIGAVTKRIEVTNEEGDTIARVVPVHSFIKRFALYPFDCSQDADSTEWLRYAMPMLVEYDVLQDPFLQAKGALDQNVFDRVKESGFKNWDGVPIALKRRLADESNMNHFVTGTVRQEKKNYIATVQVHETKSGKQISEKTYQNPSIFEMADDISADLMKAVEVPQWHLDDTQDLPVSQMVTTSEEAMREMALSSKSIIVDSDWQAASEHLDAATRADSTMAFAQYEKYLVHRLMNQQNESMKALDAALRHSYKVPERFRFVIKANYYFAHEEPDKVLAVANMMTELYPDDLLGYVVKVRVHTLRNEVDEAIATYERIIELEPYQYNHLKELGDLYVRKGDYEQPLVSYGRFAELRPDDPESYRKIGDVYSEMGDYDEAQKRYDRALLIAPERISLIVKSAGNQLQLGRFDESLDQLEKALRASRSVDDSVRVFAKLEDYYAQRGQFSKAIAVMTTRYAVASRTMPAIFGLMQHIETTDRYVHAGRRDEAMEIMKKIESEVTKPPFSKAIPFGYLKIYIAEEDPENAQIALGGVEEYIAALGLEMLRPFADYSQARIYELRGELNKAIGAYENILEQSPGFHTAYLATGRCYRKTGDLKKAESYLLKGEKHDPAGGMINYELARLYDEMGRRDEAMKHLEKTLDAWRDADPEYRSASRARETMEKWRISG